MLTKIGKIQEGKASKLMTRNQNKQRVQRKVAYLAGIATASKRKIGIPVQKIIILYKFQICVVYNQWRYTLRTLCSYKQLREKKMWLSTLGKDVGDINNKIMYTEPLKQQTPS